MCALSRSVMSDSMRFSRQEYWRGYLYPSSGNLSDSGIEPGSLALQADSLPSEPLRKPLKGSTGFSKEPKVSRPAVLRS